MPGPSDCLHASCCIRSLGIEIVQRLCSSYVACCMTPLYRIISQLAKHCSALAAADRTNASRYPRSSVRTLATKPHGGCTSTLCAQERTSRAHNSSTLRAPGTSTPVPPSHDCPASIASHAMAGALSSQRTGALLGWRPAQAHVVVGLRSAALVPLALHGPKRRITSIPRLHVMQRDVRSSVAHCRRRNKTF